MSLLIVWWRKPHFPHIIVFPHIILSRHNFTGPSGFGTISLQNFELKTLDMSMICQARTLFAQWILCLKHTKAGITLPLDDLLG